MTYAGPNDPQRDRDARWTDPTIPGFTGLPPDPTAALQNSLTARKIVGYMPITNEALTEAERENAHWEAFMRNPQPRQHGAHRTLNRRQRTRKWIATHTDQIRERIWDTTDYDDETEDYYGS